MSEPSDSDATTAVPDAPRVEITGGGEVPAELLAAVVVALTPVAGAASEEEAAARTPAWARAALLENVGLRRIAGPGDLTRPGSRL